MAARTHRSAPWPLPSVRVPCIAKIWGTPQWPWLQLLLGHKPLPSPVANPLVRHRHVDFHTIKLSLPASTGSSLGAYEWVVKTQHLSIATISFVFEGTLGHESWLLNDIPGPVKYLCFLLAFFFCQQQKFVQWQMTAFFLRSSGDTGRGERAMTLELEATANIYWDFTRSSPALFPSAYATIPGGRYFSCSHFQRRRLTLGGRRWEVVLVGSTSSARFFFHEMGTIRPVLSTDKGGYKIWMRHRSERKMALRSNIQCSCYFCGWTIMSTRDPPPHQLLFVAWVLQLVGQCVVSETYVGGGISNLIGWRVKWSNSKRAGKGSEKARTSCWQGERR